MRGTGGREKSGIPITKRRRKKASRTETKKKLKFANSGEYQLFFLRITPARFIARPFRKQNSTFLNVAVRMSCFMKGRLGYLFGISPFATYHVQFSKSCIFLVRCRTRFIFSLFVRTSRKRNKKINCSAWLLGQNGNISPPAPWTQLATIQLTEGRQQSGGNIFIRIMTDFGAVLPNWAAFVCRRSMSEFYCPLTGGNISIRIMTELATLV